nr:hypothetical protein Iba_contig4471CG0010 [Ipomoea batatas]
MQYLTAIKCHEVEMSMTLRCVFTLPPLIGLHIKHLENIFNYKLSFRHIFKQL